MFMVVVATAKLQCSCGDAPAVLSVTTTKSMNAEHKPIATIMDHKPVANIPPFGTCKTLTASASGVPTPCVPVTNSPWLGGATSVFINHVAILLQPGTLACTVGGAISITDPGQQKYAAK